MYEWTIDIPRDLPYFQDIDENVSPKDLVKEFYPELTFDFALPQNWLDSTSATVSGTLRGHKFHHHREIYNMVRVGTVWGYPKNSIFGCPVPLTEDAKIIIEHAHEISVETRHLKNAQLTVRDIYNEYLENAPGAPDYPDKEFLAYLENQRIDRP